jgi:hypothetical protein
LETAVLSVTMLDETPVIEEMITASARVGFAVV